MWILGYTEAALCMLSRDRLISHLKEYVGGC